MTAALLIPEAVGGVWAPSPHRSGDVPRLGHLPPRGVIHTTETPPGTWAAVRRDLAWPYHALVEIRERTAYQLVSLDRTAYALERPGATQTNHAGRFCVQLSLVMDAADTPRLTRSDLQWLADLCGTIGDLCGIPNVWVDTMGPNEGVVLAVPTSPIRMSQAEWYAFSGWCGHQHAPDNAHWDAGALDVATISTLITARGGAPVTAPDDLEQLRRAFNNGDTTGIVFAQQLLANAAKADPALDPGNTDGKMGPRTRRALAAAGINDPVERIGPNGWARLVFLGIGGRFPTPAPGSSQVVTELTAQVATLTADLERERSTARAATDLAADHAERLDRIEALAAGRTR